MVALTFKVDDGAVIGEQVGRAVQDAVLATFDIDLH